MMTLEEAIQHCIEKSDCTECGAEHKQLAEWLEELQTLRKKQTPMKVKDIHVDDFICPACGSENCTSDYKQVPKYCIECGQALYQVI